MFLDDNAHFPDISDYRSLVARIQMIDLFRVQPTILHHKGAISILIYLKSSSGVGLFFPSLYFTSLTSKIMVSSIGVVARYSLFHFMVLLLHRSFSI